MPRLIWPLLTSARSRPALPQSALPKTGGRVRWLLHAFRYGPQSGSHDPSRPHARQISPNKNMNCQCTTAAFTLSPVPGGLRHLVLTRPETEPSMRFLSVGSHLCARASFRQSLAGLPLPSASSYSRPPRGHYRYSYRGLSPHQFMPMSGVHKSLEADVCSAGCACSTNAAQLRRSAAPARSCAASRRGSLRARTSSSTAGRFRDCPKHRSGPAGPEISQAGPRKWTTDSVGWAAGRPRTCQRRRRPWLGGGSGRFPFTTFKGGS